MVHADAAGKPGYKPNPRLARALDIMFTLHAEHEMNCSTAAARHLASSGVDVYTAIAGARPLPNQRLSIDALCCTTFFTPGPVVLACHALLTAACLRSHALDSK